MGAAQRFHVELNAQVWDSEEAKKERAAEIKRRKEVPAAKVAVIRLREKVLKEERERQVGESQGISR